MATPLPSDAIASIQQALTLASQPNWLQALQAFETANAGGEISTLEDVLKIIGVFFPPVAIAENDLEAAIDGIELLFKFLPFLSTGQIPQVTTDLEDYIHDRFQPNT